MVEWKIKGLYKADAEAVYSEIKALGDSFSAKDVVEAARNKSSELHKCFEWNDKKAAAKYREHQARMLISQLVIKTTASENEPVAVRVISTTQKWNEYKPTVKLIESESDYANLLARATREAKAFRIKYNVISELQEIFSMIDEL